MGMSEYPLQRLQASCYLPCSSLTNCNRMFMVYVEVAFARAAEAESPTGIIKIFDPLGPPYARPRSSKRSMGPVFASYLQLPTLLTGLSDLKSVTVRMASSVRAPPSSYQVNEVDRDFFLSNSRTSNGCSGPTFCYSVLTSFLCRMLRAMMRSQPTVTQLSANAIVWRVLTICNPRRAGRRPASSKLSTRRPVGKICYAFPFPFPFMLPLVLPTKILQSPFGLVRRRRRAASPAFCELVMGKNKTCPTLLWHFGPHSELDRDREGIHAAIHAFSKASPSPEEPRALNLRLCRVRKWCREGGCEARARGRVEGFDPGRSAGPCQGGLAGAAGQRQDERPLLVSHGVVYECTWVSAWRPI